MNDTPENEATDAAQADDSNAPDELGREQSLSLPGIVALEARVAALEAQMSLLIKWLPRVVALVLLIATSATLFYFYGDQLSLQTMTKHEAEILAFQQH